MASDTNVTPLVTKRDEVAEKCQRFIQEFADLAGREPFVGIAIVGIKSDNTNYVQTYGRGDRIRLLGAVTDLQYSIAKDGDRD